MSKKHSAIKHPLLDKIAADFNLTSDLRLANFIGLGAPAICKIRSAYVNRGFYGGKKHRISGDTIITIHEQTGMSIAEIKRLAGQA